VPPVKRIIDLTEYTTVLPYASEMFGIYQPLLGWKSKRIEERFKAGFESDKTSIMGRLKTEFAGLVNVTYSSMNFPVSIQIKPGALETGKIRSFDSLVLHLISLQLPTYENYTSSIWPNIITHDALDNMLKTNVTGIYTDAITSLGPFAGPVPRSVVGPFEHQLQYESGIAGALLFLVQEQKFDALRDIFYSIKNNREKALDLITMFSAENSSEAFLNINNLDPRDIEHINSVALSPISVVHLFRQYFFELDTFLGTPVKHVWLSPGATVELIEVHSRKDITERTLETTLDMLTRSETTTTQQDEISAAVKEDNNKDLKLAASVTASYGTIQASSSLDLSTSQQQSREKTHKHMREQTDKLSSEIRKNFKTTFKTVTEITDVSSTRHTLSNTTNELVNYELRRKMRQVGVQVQDIGTYLCWRTYVDDPGRELGLSKLIHIAKPPELDSIPHPEEIPLVQAFQEEKMVTIPFISVEGTAADNEGEVYKDGVEVNNTERHGILEKIQCDFVQEFVCPKEHYTLTSVEFDPQGLPVHASSKGGLHNDDGKASFTLHLDSADFQGQNSLQLKLILHWSPLKEANQAIIQANVQKLTEFRAKERAEYEKAYVESVRERVEKASKIISRNSEELRDEERIVVYRKLIQEMLLKGVPIPDDRTRHVISELINSIFDVEKMLYFVAPEWWRPRLYRSKLQLQEIPNPSPTDDINFPVDSEINKVLKKGMLSKMVTAQLNIESKTMSANTVGWGGINDYNRDNYYITESSEPAKLGSSLGWLLQLDGDNMRNAFLNAPWVKAVIPIRPGKEEAAINWLKGVEGMNGITDDVIYHTDNPNEVDINGNPLDGQKMIDVIVDLARKIKKKYEVGLETKQFPIPNEVSDPDLVDEENVVTSIPIDRVYEHGFFPLAQSFKFNVGKDYEIYDQWLEILPTDQIVPVEVKYDPKTGRQTETGDRQTSYKLHNK
jgi:hypothetical protein